MKSLTAVSRIHCSERAEKSVIQSSIKKIIIKMNLTFKHLRAGA
jgi:hypothetical protein